MAQLHGESNILFVVLLAVFPGHTFGASMNKLAVENYSRRDYVTSLTRLVWYLGEKQTETQSLETWEEMGADVPLGVKEVFRQGGLSFRDKSAHLP